VKPRASADYEGQDGTLGRHAGDVKNAHAAQDGGMVCGVRARPDDVSPVSSFASAATAGCLRR
jgi:hypothetical protein